MKCVRCGDPIQAHCRADGSNIRNALCRAFLERWPEESAPVPVAKVVEAAPPSDAPAPIAESKAPKRSDK